MMYLIILPLASLGLVPPESSRMVYVYSAGVDDHIGECGFNRPGHPRVSEM